MAKGTRCALCDRLNKVLLIVKTSSGDKLICDECQDAVHKQFYTCAEKQTPAVENPVVKKDITLRCYHHGHQVDLVDLGDGLYVCPRCLDNFVEIKKIPMQDLLDAYRKQEASDG